MSSHPSASCAASWTTSSRRACSGCSPVSCSSDDGWWKTTRDDTAGYGNRPRMDPLRADLAVIGAGAAGLSPALCGARLGARVVLVSATPLAESASYWAQGGLAAALAAEDSVARHEEDTVTAGRGA